MSSEEQLPKHPQSSPEEPAVSDDRGLPAAESPEEQLAGVTARLDELEAENKDLRDRYLRAVADLENFRKRVRREQADAARYHAEPIVRDLLAVVDNLERAVAHAGDGESASSLAEGVGLVLKSLRDLLRQHGVAEVEATTGAPFDPAVHEAVDRRDAGGEPNRIVEVWQRGYQLHDRLLRPARVVVSSSLADGVGPQR